MLMRLLRHPRLGKTRDWVRRQRDVLDDEQFRQLRLAVRALGHGQLDVLYFGDSTLAFVSPHDLDRRHVHELLPVALGGSRRVVTLKGGGYNPELYGEFVRILGTLPQRPHAVVMSLCIRASTTQHVTRHPMYGYAGSIQRLRRVSSAQSPRRLRSRSPRPAPEVFAAFEALEAHTRWGGVKTLGESRELLRNPPTAVEDTDSLRLLFDYYHGEAVSPDSAFLEHWTRLGERLTEYGVPVIAYRNPVPVEEGEALFPGEFAAHVEQNFARIEDAFLARAGSNITIIDTGVFPTEEFLDPADATEHLNERGRQHLTQLIADGYSRAVSAPSTS